MMTVDAITLFKRRALEYCPLCGTELKPWSEESEEEAGGKISRSIKAVCTNCEIMVALVLYGDIDYDSGAVYDIEDWSIGITMANETTIEACNMDNGEPDIDYLKDHRTPRHEEGW